MDVVDIADQAAAASDLNSQARGRVDMELEFGDSEYVISICVLETRTPLPTDLLAQIRAGVPNWYPTSRATQQLMLDAIARQEQASAR